VRLKAANTRSVAKLSLLGPAVGLLVLAGCGSSSSSSKTSPTVSTLTATSAPASGAAAGSALSLAANTEGQLKYDKSSLTAKAGKVTIAFTNMAPLSHDVVVASSSGAVLGALTPFQGATKTLSVELKPGTYTFYCSVPGHRQAGMEGKLTVQ
jgi:uncharacterized cupredoxin-like copper-binding protein